VKVKQWFQTANSGDRADFFKIMKELYAEYQRSVAITKTPTEITRAKIRPSTAPTSIQVEHVDLANPHSHPNQQRFNEEPLLRTKSTSIQQQNLWKRPNSAPQLLGIANYDKEFSNLFYKTTNMDYYHFPSTLRQSYTYNEEDERNVAKVKRRNLLLIIFFLL
jgi:hypothetical protein